MTESKDVLFDSLKIDGRRVKRKHDPDTGLVSSIDGFLSAKGEGPPENVAREFVDANYRLLARRRSVVREMNVEQVAESPVGYHVTLRQTHQGVPVQDATVSIHMTKEKRVHAARGSLHPEVAELDIEAMAEGGIDSEEAITIAVAQVGAANELAAPPRVESVVVTGGEPRLAWKVSLSTSGMAQDWIVLVDVETGEILELREISLKGG